MSYVDIFWKVKANPESADLGGSRELNRKAKGVECGCGGNL